MMPAVGRLLPLLAGALLLLVGASVLAGRLLPAAPAAIFFEPVVDPGGSGWRITWVDADRGHMHRRLYAGLWMPDAGLEATADCRVHFSRPLLDATGRIVRVQVALLNLQDGRYTTYDLPDYSNFAGQRAWSPDAAQLWLRYTDAVRRRQAYSVILTPATGAAWVLPLPMQSGGGMVWSPDSRYGIVYELNRRTTIENQTAFLADTHTQTLRPLPPGNLFYWRWSPDSRRFAGLDVDTQTITLLNSAGQPTATLAGFAEVMDVQWLTAERLLLLARRTDDADPALVRGYEWSPDDGTLQPTPLRVPALTGRLESQWQWSPGHDYLYYSVNNTRAAVIASAGTTPPRTITPAGYGIGSAAWSPDGRYLFIHYRFGYLLRVEPASGTPARYVLSQERLRMQFDPQQAEMGYFNRRLPGLERLRFDAPQLAIAGQVTSIMGQGLWCYRGGAV